MGPLDRQPVRVMFHRFHCRQMCLRWDLDVLLHHREGKTISSSWKGERGGSTRYWALLMCKAPAKKAHSQLCRRGELLKMLGLLVAFWHTKGGNLMLTFVVIQQVTRNSRGWFCSSKLWKDPFLAECFCFMLPGPSGSWWRRGWWWLVPVQHYWGIVGCTMQLGDILILVL